MSITPVSVSEKTLISPVPKDENIIANRRMAFLFAQDLFGLKTGSTVKKFKEKHKSFPVTELVAMLFLKLRKESRKSGDEAFLYAEALLALIELQPKVAKTVAALQNFLKIQETDLVRATKFKRLVSCFQIDAAWLQSQKVESLPFLTEMKVLSLLPKIMEASRTLMPSIHGLLDELSQATVGLKASYETFVQVNGQLELGEKQRKKSVAKRVTAATTADWTFFQKFTGDEIVNQQSIAARGLLAAWTTGHKKPLSLLQNLFKIEPVFGARVLLQVAKAIKDFQDPLQSNIRHICQRTMGLEDSFEATLLAKYTESTQRVATCHFAGSLMARKELGTRLNDFGFLFDKLLLFVSLFSKESAAPLAAVTEKESQDMVAEIEALYCQEEIQELAPVDDERFDEPEVEEAEEAQQSGVMAPPKLLLAPEELYERGLHRIIEGYLQQDTGSKSLSIVTETAAFLCCLIQKKPRFVKEEYAKLEAYERRCMKAAIEEAKDHLYLSATGFEAFAELLEKQDLFSLASVFRMLILDWHMVAEQSRRLHYIVKNQKAQKSHHLLDFDQEEKGATREFLQALDYGLVWARFPKSSMVGSTASWPVGLQWMQFCQKLQTKIQKKSQGTLSTQEINQLHELVDFVCSCQLNVWNDGCGLLCKESAFELFPEVMQQLKAQVKGYLKSLVGKPYSDLRSAPTHDLQGAALVAFEEIKKKKKWLAKSEHLANMKRHLLDLHALIGLWHANQRGKFDVFFERNLFNVQWVIESSYRRIAAYRGIKYIKDHDFTVLQNFLSSAGVAISEEEEKYVAPFNLREMVYYPRYVEYTRGNLSPHLKAVQAKIKEAQRLSLHREEFPSRKYRAALEPVLLEGLAVVSKHIERY